jgi:hypothetical protein
MQRVQALGLDASTTQELFDLYDRVMSEFAAVRVDFSLHEGLRNTVAVAILEMVQDGELNLQVVEFHALTAGRAYLKKLSL